MRHKLDLRNLLITEHSNSVMSCDSISIDGISIDQFQFFFLHLACDYSYFIQSNVALYNVLLDESLWITVYSVFSDQLQ